MSTVRPVIGFPPSYIQTGSIREMSLSPDNTPEGYLPPFEVAKAYALHLAMEAVEKELGKPLAWQFHLVPLCFRFGLNSVPPSWPLSRRSGHSDSDPSLSMD